MISTAEFVAQADAKDEDGMNGDLWLLEQLGDTALGFAQTTEIAQGESSASFGTRSGEDKVAIGSRILKRVERELNVLLCGDGDEEREDRERLGLSGDALIGIITTALTTGLSVGPQASAIIAALLVRRLVQPTTDELCVYWGERLR
ncbi:hypothetical protein SLH49_05205 [Cognatiyoonia sp. IB215446]|uniref:hypothetical protein n=1 Tax=Cognatiyoonia sp. IB215446 TaxID=3097355 RepID=UPI002A0F83C0|nr:hypothetical protein [Cognatiyoonia sp. IB215446]MDX8347379.1 hypothetical protein [Cognatiyoonia sp. IB215446]